MTQSDLKLEHAGVSGPAFAVDTEAALRAVASWQMGPGAPPETFPGLVWADTSATPWVVRMRNGADDGWIELFRIDDTDDKLTMALKLLTMAGPLLGFGGTSGAPGYAFSGDPDTGLYRPSENEIALVAGGAEILQIAGTLISALRLLRLANLPTASLPAAGAGNLGALAYDTTLGTIVGNADGVAWQDLLAGGAFETKLLHVWELQADGIDAGTFTSGAWRQRTLNSVNRNEISGASLSANVISLPAGKYFISASAPALGVNSHQARLWNVNGANTERSGTVENSPSSATNSSRSIIAGRFDIAAGGQDVEIQHRAETTRSSHGFGKAASFGMTEVYAHVLIWRLD